MNYRIRQTAIDAYDEATNTIEEMFNMFKLALANKGSSFNVRTELNGFDVLLQYSMMQVALKDDYLHVEEVKLIRDLSKYCDFCDYLNQRGYRNVTWQMVLNTDERTLKSILSDYQDDMINLSKDFIAVFSLVDKAIVERRYLDELKDQVAKIIGAVAYADGELDDTELSGSCMIISAIQVIEKIIYENEVLSDESPKVSSKKSLKDFYVKKN